MNIRDLIDLLEDVASQTGDDTPVRIAYQPNYPLAAQLDAVTLFKAGAEPGNGRDSDVVWLAASSGVPYSENPYASSLCWDGTVVVANDEPA